MALFFKFDVNDDHPTSPDDLALSANETADQASDARKSREAYENHVQQETKHPVHTKFVKAPKVMILTCAVLSLAFLCVLLWEWDISREIYTVLFPQAPIFPFLVGVFSCFLASVCLGETSAHFRLSFLGDQQAKNDEQKTKSIIGTLYDRSTTRAFVSSWFFHPLFGIILAVGVLTAIYFASQYRVQLLTEAGELTGSEYHVYVPMVLYGLEIVFGIPTYFMLLWLHCWLRVRQHRRKFTQMRDFEVVLRNTALRKFNEYTASLEQYNEWARKKNWQPRALIPPNQALRQLIKEEYNYDPLAGTTNNAADDSQATEDNVEPEQFVETENQTQTNSTLHQESPQSNDQEDRVDDLLNLVDEQIRNNNQGL